MTKGINKTLSKELTAVLNQLIELYAYDTCMKSIGDLLRVSVQFYYLFYLLIEFNSILFSH